MMMMIIIIMDIHKAQDFLNVTNALHQHRI